MPSGRTTAGNRCANLAHAAVQRGAAAAAATAAAAAAACCRCLRSLAAPLHSLCCTFAHTPAPPHSLQAPEVPEELREWNRTMLPAVAIGFLHGGYKQWQTERAARTLQAISRPQEQRSGGQGILFGMSCPWPACALPTVPCC